MQEFLFGQDLRTPLSGWGQKGGPWRTRADNDIDYSYRRSYKRERVREPDADHATPLFRPCKTASRPIWMIVFAHLEEEV
jgi:hypothetical protein